MDNLRESNQVTADHQESLHVSADLPESSHVTAGLPESRHISAVHPESRHVSADLPESLHVSADCPESCHITADCPESRHVTADCPEVHHVSSDLPEPLYSMSATPGPRHSAVVVLQPSTVVSGEIVIKLQRLASSVENPPLVSARTVGIPKPAHFDPPGPAPIPLSPALPVMHLSVALLSSVACELAPLRIVLLCVFLYLCLLLFLHV